MSAPVTVTREDALRFCNTAMRNWQHSSIDEEELEDLRVELDRFRLATEAAFRAREDALAEALAQIAYEAPDDPAFVAHAALRNTAAPLARAKASSDVGGTQ